MKKVLIILGVVAVIGGILLIVALFKVAHVVRDAEGRAFYSGIGAWTRIQEFAHASGKTNYIAEADRKMAFLQQQLSDWQQNIAGQDISSFEKMKATAYETTDKNIKNGLNPLAYLDAPNTALEPTATAPSVSTNK
jgi:hypothetical protein